MWHIAVLWGLDGTLIDNDEVLFERLRAAVAKHRLVLSHDEFFDKEHAFDMPDGDGGWTQVSLRLHGASDKALYYWLASRKPAFARKVTPEAWIAALARAHDRLAAQAHARAHLAGFIRALHGHGIVQGLVTNASPDVVAQGLEQLGDLGPCFAFTCYGDEHTLPKPYPEVHRAAAARANELLCQRHGDACRPLVLAVENPRNGVRGAHAAGLSVVQFLKPGQTPAPRKADDPELRVVRDLRTFADILVTLSGS